MADQLQLRGGTTTEHNTFTGASKEVTVDTTKKTAVVHDGATAGGNPLMREDGANSALALGSAGTPSLKFTGDTNTGIYSPGADQVAVSTGGTQALYINADGDILVADGNRMEIDEIRARDGDGLKLFDDAGAGIFVEDGGNVGIGTTSPSSVLDVRKVDAGNEVFGIISANEGTSANSKVSISLVSGSDGVAGRIRSQIVADSDGTNNGYLAFNTRLSGSQNERARIDSSGRLLVGTASPVAIGGESDAKLQLVDASATSASWFNLARFVNSAGAPAIQFGKSRGTTVGSYTSVQDGDGLGTILFAGSDGTDLGSYGARIGAEVDGTPGANDMPGRLVFSTTADGASTPTERLRISQNGQFRAFSATTVIRAFSATGSGTSEYLYGGYHSSTDNVGSGSTLSFAVFTNGDVVNTNNSYGAISDIKLKENIVDANSQWDDLKALQVRNYNFKEGQTHTQIGLVAQEVELVSPGLVSESPDRDADGNDLGTVTKSVNYSVLYMKAVKALQEAIGRIETLEAEVAALKAQ